MAQTLYCRREARRDSDISSEPLKHVDTGLTSRFRVTATRGARGGGGIGDATFAFVTGRIFFQPDPDGDHDAVALAYDSRSQTLAWVVGGESDNVAMFFFVLVVFEGVTLCLRPLCRTWSGLLR